jgi:hypothetical protein
VWHFSSLSPPGFRHRLMRRTFLYYILVELAKVIKNIYLYSLYTSTHYSPIELFIQVDNQLKPSLLRKSPRNHHIPRTIKLDPPFTSLPCLPNPYCNEHRKRLVIIGYSRIIAELGFLSVRHSIFIQYSPLSNLQRYHATSSSSISTCTNSG